MLQYFYMNSVLYCNVFDVVPMFELYSLSTSHVFIYLDVNILIGVWALRRY